MCLYTSQRKAIILDKDIMVYKNCYIDYNTHCNKLRAKYVNHYYSKIETAPIRITHTSWSKEYRNSLSTTSYKISSGLHAKSIKNSCCNTEWIIPKGSKIFYNYTNNYIVSNKMIFNRFLYNDEFVLEKDIDWAKPSISRFIKKWYRWFKNDY